MKWTNDQISTEVALLESLFTSNPAEAIKHAEKLVKSAQDQEDYDAELCFLDEVAWWSINRLSWHESYKFIEKAMQLADNMGNNTAMARFNNYFGILYDTNGEHLKAIQHYSKAYELNEIEGNSERCGAVLTNIAALMHDIGANDLALNLFKEALPKIGSRISSDILATYAQVLYKVGNRTEAWEALLKCRSLIYETLLDESETSIHATLGWFFRQEGRLEYSLKHYQKELAQKKATNDDYYVIDTMLEIADIMTELGRKNKAIDMLQQASIINSKHGFGVIEQALLIKLIELGHDMYSSSEILKIQERLQELVKSSDEKDRKSRAEFTAMQLETHNLRQERSKLMHDYIHDTLTGLISYRHYKDRLKLAMDSSKFGAVLFIDMDHLKEVNDRDGHSGGDLLLKSFANRLKLLLPSSATAFRKGGDEFLVVLPDYDQTSTKVFLDNFMEKLSEIDADKNQHTCSVGFAYWPYDAYDTSALERMADYAMYTAKRNGRAQYAFYNKLHVESK